MSLLETVRSPEDVKAMDSAGLNQLCQEIRSFLISNISHTGGHLASNLGTVELSVALHRVLDTRCDRVVFDVGHQCYTHKILTCRQSGFSGLRSLGQLSGFPKPEESTHDAFATGHASTSVSAALGMARARTLQGESYRVLAVIGDGALTGGLAYEGLNDAGQSGEPLVVILNDNEMSITRNVGAVSRHLATLRVKPQYFKLKKMYHHVLDPIPGGKHVDRFLHRIKTAVKDTLLPGSMFESMGFYYLGPIDGHDVEAVSRLLQTAINLKRPVLLHLVTKKGKGYTPSEENPSAYHGVAQFDIVSGQSLFSRHDSFSEVFGQTLCHLAESDPRICAVTAAMRDGTGLAEFARRFPERFFDVGIAEAHAVTMAAGLAKQGMRPVCAVYSTFLQRAYDQILHDVALQKLPVVFAVDRAGLVGEDGETHHGVFDPAFFAHIPHLAVYTPASFQELTAMLRYALTCNFPVAVRYPRGGEGAYSGCQLSAAHLRRGDDLTMVTYGTMINPVLSAAEKLARAGIEADVIKLPGIRPLDSRIVLRSVEETGKLSVIEDCVYEGSPGQRLVSELVSLQCPSFQTKLLNLGDRFVTHGSPSDLARLCGLDSDGIFQSLTEALFRYKTPARVAVP